MCCVVGEREWEKVWTSYKGGDSVPFITYLYGSVYSHQLLVWIARRSHHVFGVDKTEIAPPLPRPCCRKTFLASTVGDGKSELLKKKQRKAWAICHHAGPPPPPWQPPACCFCVHCPFQKKRNTRKAGTFEERSAWTQLFSRCVFFRRYSWQCNSSAHVLKRFQI